MCIRCSTCVFAASMGTFHLGGVLFPGTLMVMTWGYIQLCESCKGLGSVGPRLGTYFSPCAVDRCSSCCTACRHVFQDSFLLKSQNPATRFTYPSQKSKHDVWNLAYIVNCRSAGRSGTRGCVRCYAGIRNGITVARSSHPDDHVAIRCFDASTIRVFRKVPEYAAIPLPRALPAEPLTDSQSSSFRF